MLIAFHTIRNSMQIALSSIAINHQTGYTLFARLAVASVAVAVVALAGLAGFLGVVLVVARERVVQVNGGFDFAVLVAPDVALVTRIGLD